jgi:hypothetical protein
MRGKETRTASGKRRHAWLALALLPLLTGCLGAAIIPILASGPLLGRHHVRAATPIPKATRKSSTLAHTKAAPEAAATPAATASPATLPAASNSPPAWQRFFAFALASEGASGNVASGQSVLLTDDPPLDMPSLRTCPKPVPAVVIDLDAGMSTFDPRRLGHAPAGVPEGLEKLREAGIVILWISQLPAARAADVAQALRAADLDPIGADQLLLIRNAKDRKELLRDDANDDVCIVAIAGDRRADFDELFDYLRHPAEAAPLDAMLGKGWFLVPPLQGPATAAQ